MRRAAVLPLLAGIAALLSNAARAAEAPTLGGPNGRAPILFGASMVLLILTWRRGTHILARKTQRTEVPLDTLLGSLQKHPPHIVPGTAVFLTSQPDFAPTALLHNLKHNKVLHERNVILTIVTTDTPRVADEERVKITDRAPHFSLMALKFGYMESPNVPKALALARKHGWPFDIMSTSFFLSRRALKPAIASDILAAPGIASRRLSSQANFAAYGA